MSFTHWCRGSGSLSIALKSLQFLSGMLKDQETLDWESSQLEEVDVVGGNGSEDTTAVDVDTLLEGLPDVGLFF